MAISPHEAQKVLAAADCLYTTAEVHQAIDRMAAAITDRLADSNPLVLTIMQGGLITAGQLSPRLGFPLQMDYIHASRYAGNTHGGELQWIVRPAAPLAGKTLLLIDDIHDEGLTLEAIIRDCREAGADEIHSAVLVNKVHDRKQQRHADFSGLEVPDRYVFGYGMDYKGYLRNAAGIYAVNEHV